MNTFKSYIRPAKKANEPSPAVAPTYNEKSDSPQTPRTPYSVQSPDYSGVNTPRSRASLHPEGDFRNNADEHVNEIKHMVALEWVYQMQQEHTWSSNSYGEGVVIRKGVGKFAAAPRGLEEERGGLFDAARELNARVSRLFDYTSRSSELIRGLASDDSQYVRHPNHHAAR